MMNDETLFDRKMKERFKKEVYEIPENIHLELENISNRIRSREENPIKKSSKRKRIGLAAASVFCVLWASTVIMQTAFAQDILNQIIRNLSLKNITIFENKDYQWEDKDIPAAAKGKVFDKDKNIIEKITLANKDEMYDAHGERVFDVDPDGTLITEAVQRENAERNAKENPIDNLIIKDPKKLNGYTCFDVKLPSYLPEGFEFDYAEFYKDDNGKIYDEMCSLNFINLKTDAAIYISQTYISEETSSETAFNNIEKTKVNGRDAIVGDEGIVWEVHGIRYLMYTYDLGRVESVKIAESIR
ncbi:MAG: DUF4367 domain-containing protein [Thermotaleaceae bacterium]